MPIIIVYLFSDMRMWSTRREGCSIGGLRGSPYTSIASSMIFNDRFTTSSSNMFPRIFITSLIIRENISLGKVGQRSSTEINNCFHSLPGTVTDLYECFWGRIGFGWDYLPLFPCWEVRKTAMASRKDEEILACSLDFGLRDILLLSCSIEWFICHLVGVLFEMES